MYTNLWLKIIVLAILLKKSRSECVCRDNSQQEIICTQNGSQNQGTSIDQNLSQKTTLPFNNIKTLQLQCNVQTVSPNWFLKLDSLLNLDLSQNKIIRITPTVLKSFKYLEILNISHNLLRNPPSDTFDTLDHLKVLDLSFNRITNIERSSLDKITTLEKLHLNNNGLFEMAPEIFEDLVNIKEIDLSNNHIRSIDKKLFKNLVLLENLNVAENNFYDEDTSENIFRSLSKLKHLNMSNTNVKLVSGLLNNNTELMSLDLTKNKLQKLPQGIFTNLRKLQTLNLAFCQLLTLPEDLLDQILQLEELNLSYNNLRSTPSNFFNNAKNLKILNMANNLFRSISGSSFQNTKLSDLDLSFNLLTNISPELLNLPTLLNVNLQNNKLVTINELSLSSYIFPIKYLNLHSNHLVFIKLELFKVMPNLNQLEILGNPWNCKCLDKLLEIVSSKE